MCRMPCRAPALRAEKKGEQKQFSVPPANYFNWVFLFLT